MSEIKKELFKVPPGIKYFASGKERVADGETFVITKDHTLSDILRFCIQQSGGDIDEIKTILYFIETSGGQK